MVVQVRPAHREVVEQVVTQVLLELLELMEARVLLEPVGKPVVLVVVERLAQVEKQERPAQVVVLVPRVFLARLVPLVRPEILVRLALAE
jgi:hypothetical protein